MKVLLVAFSLLLQLLQAMDSARETTVEIQHFTSGQFSLRSSYKISESSITALNTDQNTIQDVDGFKHMLEENALYRIRVVTRTADGTSKTVSASIPACELQKSGFKDDLTLHLDNNDQIIGLSYSSPEIILSRSCDPSLITGPVPLQTRVKLAEPDVAQVIPIQVFGPKPQTMATIYFDAQTDPTVQTKEQQQANQPFLTRYWYLIVPTCVYLILTTLSGGDDVSHKKK